MPGVFVRSPPYDSAHKEGAHIRNNSDNASVSTSESLRAWNFLTSLNFGGPGLDKLLGPVCSKSILGVDRIDFGFRAQNRALSWARACWQRMQRLFVGVIKKFSVRSLAKDGAASDSFSEHVRMTSLIRPRT